VRLSLRKAHGVYQRHKPPQEIGAMEHPVLLPVKQSGLPYRSDAMGLRG
jgi:hypothetical protein